MTEADEIGRRISEAVNRRIAVDGFYATGRWMVFTLADCTTDGVLYDTKPQAVSHQLNEFRHAYMCITPDGITPQDAYSWLLTMRKFFDAGLRIADPDRHVTMRG